VLRVGLTGSPNFRKSKRIEDLAKRLRRLNCKPVRETLLRTLTEAVVGRVAMVFCANCGWRRPEWSLAESDTRHRLRKWAMSMGVQRSGIAIHFAPTVVYAGNHAREPYGRCRSLGQTVEWRDEVTCVGKECNRSERG